MKDKKKLMPWEHEKWEEKRRETIRTRKLIAASEQKVTIKVGPIKIEAHGEWKFDFYDPQLEPIEWIPFEPKKLFPIHRLDTGTSIQTSTTSQWNGVRFKQVERNPINPLCGTDRWGQWIWDKRMVTYYPGERPDITVYHEMGHCFNGDMGVNFMMSISGETARIERKAWMTASLLIDEADIDYFIDEATLCLKTYGNNKPITREEIIEHRENNKKEGV